MGQELKQCDDRDEAEQDPELADIGLPTAEDLLEVFEPRPDTSRRFAHLV